MSFSNGNAVSLCGTVSRVGEISTRGEVLSRRAVLAEGEMFACGERCIAAISTVGEMSARQFSVHSDLCVSDAI